ncbi:MAG: glycosyltransferase, partial [Chloroflexaceae bacterium]|nr:glycosyltransferase [Chloroflexaceae bacterium]
MAQVLLTVSARMPGPEVIARIARGESRRIDYLELAAACDADLIDIEGARREGPISRIVARLLGGQAALAWVCFRRRRAYAVICSDNEGVGLPLATLLKYLTPFARRQPQLVMIGHDLLSWRKRPFFSLLRVQSHIQYHFVFNQLHQRELQRRWGVPAERIVRFHVPVDTAFFHPRAIRPTPRANGRPQICAVGIEARDYPTLMRAVAGLEVDVVIAAASPWSHQADSSKEVAPPPNVAINRDLGLDVRQLYADSAFVVIPLVDVDRPAGSTTILEAMAMGKAVICSRARGQQDLVLSLIHI